jgi:hypothetical protein
MKVLAAIGVGVPVLGLAIAMTSYKYCKPIQANVQSIQDDAGLILKNTPDASVNGKSCEELIGRMAAEFPEIRNFSVRALKACPK